MKLSLLISLSGLMTFLAACTVKADTFDQTANWEVERGFDITLDSSGYTLPTAIAFVPEPGDKPDDPLYFVTELRGNIKVVTNDRTVHIFAGNVVESDFPPESGMAGICLEPEHGYVFVTFAYMDANKAIRNNIVRFETGSSTFALAPTSQVSFADIFLPYESGASHQIGGCQIKEGLLYVSLGDGFNTPQKSQQLDQLLGKVARMTLDGKPVASNPFYQDDDIQKAANFVWAYGLRNPFGLKTLGDRFFVADNGLLVDRFIEIEEGQNYLWDGTDWSLGTNSDFVLTPSFGVVQLDYLKEESTISPEQYRKQFYLALSGAINKGKKPGILALEYDTAANKLVSVPKTFVRYRGGAKEATMAGLAFGPDGLYFAPIQWFEPGTAVIFKVTYNPDGPHPYTLVYDDDPVSLMRSKGCLGCHMVTGGGTYGGTAGPTLESDLLVPRLKERLNSQAYERVLAEIDQMDREPFVSYKEARKEVLAAEGAERVRTWVKYRVQEPRFDSLYSQMPNLGITESEAELITAYLLAEEPSLLLRVAERILPGNVGRRHLVFYFVGGFFFGLVIAGLAFVAWRVVRRLISDTQSS